MAKVEMSESAYLKQPKEPEENEIGEIYGDKGYRQIPIDQINLNTEPISIINDFNHSILDTNIKSYIKVFLGFVIFVIILLLISILSGHFHYEKPEISEKKQDNKKMNNDGDAIDNNNDNNRMDKINNKRILLDLNKYNNDNNGINRYYSNKYKLD